MAKLFLEEGSQLVYLGARQWLNPKNSNMLTFVKLGDPTSFENHEFMVDVTKISTNFQLNSNIIAEFEMGVYNGRTSLNLIGLKVPQVISGK